ncbi:MAG: hypothetical protein ABW208_17990 [Pyrinomonadaceae bacterium]
MCGMCLLLLAVATVVGQDGKTVGTAPEAKNEGKPPSAPQTPEGTPDLRRVQLRMLREGALSRVVAGIKDINEAALRISARNEILMHLGDDRKADEENGALTAQIASDALADFGEHAEEIPPFMADYLFNDLGAWIQKHQPKLAERLEAVEKSRKRGNESDRIRALLQMKGGDALAAQRLRRLLAEGQEVDGLVFHLDALRQAGSKEFEPLLTQLVEAAERGPQVSLETLFWVSDVYLRPDVPTPLRRRFLATVVSRTQPANFAVESVPQTAYELLSKVLPFLRELAPGSYDQAVAQSYSLRASLNDRQLATEARNKRISESPDPFADLLDEVEAAPSKGERNELLAGAARLALERKRFDLCLEIVAKLDRDAKGTPPDFWRNWADQFLKELVKAALAAKDAEQAEKGAGRIASPLARVEGLALLLRFRAKANDRIAAQRTLAEAAKVADNASDNLERAKAFLLLSLVSDAADESAKAGLLEAAIKALNGVTRPDRNAGDKKLYQQYLRGLDNTGYQLIRGFRELAKKDEIGALSLSENLRQPDLRAFALIGVLQGLDASLVAAK